MSLSHVVLRVRRQKTSSGRRFVACCVANKRYFHIQLFLLQTMSKVQPKLFQQNIESLKLCSRVAVFKKASLLIEGGSSPTALRPPAFIVLLLTSKKAN